MTVPQQKDVCDITCEQDEKIHRAKEHIQNAPTADVSVLLKALADQTRLTIAYALLTEEELCVCDIATIVDCSTATASHHLRHLRKLGLAKYRKDGKLAYYSLDDDHVKQIVNLAFTHQQEVSDRV
ncbi:ArsR/SmtB family transcription factor [Pontibacillus litoralis]|uniref:ArsR family transcriptional regulator n=1 Tax=Pontibacillus litoralis JSM 072002 TaxID=1385512 RepID=A0A0A5G669_9BACI|nr:metalloregulator ArsR/SmtB family transcription factor [Pontibacillus litoralis]KGX86580.1 ArsR family transcriptional regulator [Pontibacillus litoralis JSM 072002]